ncbi:MAG: DUF3310 domain-containing protein [Caulobacteraceae bacterium]|nr:DUF3310 domain-containing protein [Caulobacteraceae bacterium]
MSQIETGERRLNGKTIDKLANGLGIDVRDLDEVNFGGIPECDEAISSILPPIPEPTILVTKKKADPIRPAHYQSGDGDVIDFTNKYDLDFTRGSAVKYIARAGKKDPATEAQDLEKAIECLRRAIEFCKAKEAGE